jgi:hypothetical protein
MSASDNGRADTPRTRGQVAVEGVLGAVPFGDIGVVGILSLVALLVITDKLVWHTRLRKAEAKVDELQRLLYVALGVADKMTTAAEVTNEVMSRFPDPARDEAEM